MSLALVIQLLVAGTPALPAAEVNPPEAPEEAPKAPREATLEPLATAPPAPAAMEWYGWQILAADGVGIALGSVGVPVYLATYWVIPPFIHFRQGNPSLVAWDLGLRLGLPLAGAVGVGLYGRITATGGSMWDDISGAVIGCLAAVVIDAAFLAWRPARPAPARAARSPRWAPMAGIVRGTPFAGVAGAF